MQNENTNDDERILVTLPLVDYMEALLGDNDYKAVSQSVAIAIYALTRNKKIAYVQFPDDPNAVNLFGQHIQVCILWRHKSYYASCEAYVARKLRGEKDRQEWELRKYNINQAKITIMKFAGLDEKFALPLAVSKVDKNQEDQIIAMGGKPFAKTIEEIQ